ncbi:MAG: HDOD domain-containing protein [Clostridiales Family XIII bacterium]|jgi:EAL and modified HD-GYP domain-containing signal transduction protein|nr:HDOD domain-containing protein [Clostridiales Family XIII bacterium]
MDLLIVPVPLFNEDIAVEAYYFRHRKGNDLLDGTSMSVFDGAMLSPPLEMLNLVSMEALTMDKPIFVPVTKYMLLSRLELQSHQKADKIIFMIDGNEIEEAEPYLANIENLKALGYRFGLQRISDVEKMGPILEKCDYVFYDHRVFDYMADVKIRITVAHRYKHITSVYTHVNNMDLFKDLRLRYKGLFEGHFYRTPLTKGKQEVSPLQVNLINLLNKVRDENFEFDEISDIIQKDPMLTVSLLRLVNSAYFSLREKVKSINQAVVMLGQTEIRKWITTAVSRLLGAEKPGEVTRLSLIRARFAEELANKFGMEKEAQSLFLMGLFSVLDAILDRPIEEALDMVHVSEDIRDALVNRTGKYSVIFQFILEYEAANWNVVSRLLILNDLDTEAVYRSYVNAMVWYNEIIGGDHK